MSGFEKVGYNSRLFCQFFFELKRRRDVRPMRLETFSLIGSHSPVLLHGMPRPLLCLES